MPLLTLQMLDQNNLYRMGRHMNYTAFHQGQELHSKKNVQLTEFTGDTATCQVKDRSGQLTVKLTAVNATNLQLACECALAAKNQLCGHMIAAAIAVREYIQTEAQQQWRYQLQLGLEQAAPVSRPSRPQRYLVVFRLVRQPMYTGNYSWSLFCYTLKTTRWAPLATLKEELAPDEYRQFLEETPGWVNYLDAPRSALNPGGCLNIPPGEVAFVNFMFQHTWYYGGLSNFAEHLPLLARWQVPLYLSEKGQTDQMVEILAEPVNIEAALGRDGDKLVLQTGLRLGERVFSSINDRLQLISHSPVWALAGRYLVQVANPEALPIIQVAPLIIPAKDEELFREQFFSKVAERVSIQGDVVTWEEVETPPTPRLYLSDESGTLRATLHFGYGEYEVDCERNPPTLTVEDLPNSWTLARIHRDVEKEAEYYQMFTDARYGLKRAGRELPYGTFELRARTHPFDFLSGSISALTALGFEIYGEEKLKTGRINRAKPTISLGLTSGLDWFDLDAVIKYGDQEVPFGAVRKALRKGQRYVKLADGSVGELPETWLERYKRLFEMAEETADGGMRIADYHLPLLDPLLDDAPDTQLSAEFEERRQRLRNFEKIAPQPLPVEFTGELRPYQKAGLDWLHFLNQYKFGGCLADDMGLGKTIQVLALLQSLREQGKTTGASLLVVPKSLVVNWQRESERFTPELRFLEYMGNSREKDTSTFKDYDVVITTYGTMLRDIDLLRKHHFDYAILDESQAIKNPMSKSARASRLLQAAHRLVLTGTPVENNTFELWSQFAFLNPGLLGNVDYFKSEFAGPIERGNGEDAAQTLRQLIYPFVLRRTKEQVAPELPPRTERVMYVDMVPAQKKLYKRTLDYYRGLLLGMIEDNGIDDARMKILEGLLRLRQVSIHPLLVESKYRGEAPKFELLLETLESLHGTGHKALIFSQFVEVLTLLRKELDAKKISYAYLDGQTSLKKRQEQVDAFQEDPKLAFFLISLKAGGVGLNLTAADYVIHLDPWWNPAVERQASDRTHRIGQDKPVFVYKLITRDSVEEKILKLQERKQQLVEQLISAEGSFFKALTAEDVQVLFS